MKFITSAALLCLAAVNPVVEAVPFAPSTITKRHAPPNLLVERIKYATRFCHQQIGNSQGGARLQEFIAIMPRPLIALPDTLKEMKDFDFEAALWTSGAYLKIYIVLVNAVTNQPLANAPLIKAAFTLDPAHGPPACSRRIPIPRWTNYLEEKYFFGAVDIKRLGDAWDEAAERMFANSESDSDEEDQTSDSDKEDQRPVRFVGLQKLSMNKYPLRTWETPEAKGMRFEFEYSRSQFDTTFLDSEIGQPLS